MWKPNLLTPCLVGATVVVCANPVAGNETVQATEVARIAKNSVVRIEPKLSPPGSGVIIGRYRDRGTNVYVVLTTAHVVQNIDDDYQIVTPLPLDGSGGSMHRQKMPLMSGNIQKLPQTDLAVIRFRSNRLYTAATLGDSNDVSAGAGIYLAGFLNPSTSLERRIFQFSSALVSSRLDEYEERVEGERRSQTLEGGYALVYDQAAHAGMSGGPLLDQAGRVIGIHGLGQEDPYLKQGSIAEPVRQIVNSGFNLGIPIRRFLRIVPTARQYLGVTFEPAQLERIPAAGVVVTPTQPEQPATNIIEEETIRDEVLGTPPPRNEPLF